ncbi:hypothetical protein FQA39_LY12984 [Lamprigera yunnana]|nr:hypothetical protein FQA39_LY12984 [Lamprigera yunnana]
MSKSLGNIVDPLQIIDQYSADALRFYIAYELPTEKDGNFTNDLFVESFNAHLANNIGNLISRTNNMITKYFDGKLNNINNVDQTLINVGNQAIDKYCQLMDQYKISEAVRVVLDLGMAYSMFIKNIMLLFKKPSMKEVKSTFASMVDNKFPIPDDKDSLCKKFEKSFNKFDSSKPLAKAINNGDKPLLNFLYPLPQLPLTAIFVVTDVKDLYAIKADQEDITNNSYANIVVVDQGIKPTLPGGLRGSANPMTISRQRIPGGEIIEGSEEAKASTSFLP